MCRPNMTLKSPNTIRSFLLCTQPSNPSSLKTHRRCAMNNSDYCPFKSKCTHHNAIMMVSPNNCPCETEYHTACHYARQYQKAEEQPADSVSESLTAKQPQTESQSPIVICVSQPQMNLSEVIMNCLKSPFKKTKPTQ